MLRLFVTLVAAVGAYLGLAEIWNGCRDAAFTYHDVPVSWQLLATFLAVVMALSVGR